MKKNITLAIVSFAMFMEAVDTTVINTAIPNIARSLSVNPIDLKLALISYLLSLAIFIPISGWIAEKYGIKKVFIFAIAIFTISSIWCGFTDSLRELITARIVQGFGGALTLPVGRLIIVRTCERHELISKTTIVVMLGALGMMLGPVLGGIITHYFSWRWIFWINVPIGCIAIVLSLKLLPQIPSITIYPLDKFGFVLFGSGLSLFTLGLTILSETNIQSAYTFFLIPLSLLLLIIYAWHSYSKDYPIVKIELFHIRTFQVSVIGNLISRIGFGGIPFLLPLLLQIEFGFSPQLSGFLLAPIALGVLLVKPMSLYILRFIGYKKLLIVNTFLVGLALWTFCSINAASSILYIGFLTFIYGFLIALQYTGMNSLAYAKIDPRDFSAATSIMSTVQQVAQSFGVAIAAIFLRVFIKYSNNIMSIGAFHKTFFAMGLLTILSVYIFLHLRKNDGQELIAQPDIS